MAAAASFSVSHETGNPNRLADAENLYVYQVLR